MLIPGSGEIGQRLARGLDIKGRVQVEVDESVVPVAQVINLDQPPHRTDGVIAFGGQARTAAALQFPACSIFNPTSQNQIVDYVLIGNPVAGEWTISLATDAIAARPLAGGTQVSLISTENVQEFQVDGLILTPLLALSYSVAAVPIPGTVDIGRGVVPASHSVLVPLDLVLPPGKQLFVSTVLAAGTLFAMFRARYFRVARR